MAFKLLAAVSFTKIDFPIINPYQFLDLKKKSESIVNNTM